jgi:phosphate transport system permease protein
MKTVAQSTLYRRRKLANVLTQGGSIVAAGIGLGALVLIIWTLFYNGIASINLAIFTEMTPPPGSAGGLLNAIVGSVIMSVVGVVVATPIAVLAGTYLAEYGRYSTLAKPTRFVTDILLSAPSIVIGLFVYEVMVVNMGHFSAWAGAMALAIIVVPVVVRTTENMLGLVPDSLREAATALGTPRWKVIQSVCYRAARQGILTGIMLAVARVSGETAPLLFTALNNQFWSTDLNAPMSNMPVVIFQFAMSPYEDWQKLAWGGALLITLSVLSLNVFARILITAKSQRP